MNRIEFVFGTLALIGLMRLVPTMAQAPPGPTDPADLLCEQAGVPADCAAASTAAYAASASCSRRVGFNQWQTYCLDEPSFNTMPGHVTMHSDGRMEVHKSGVYRVVTEAFVDSIRDSTHRVGIKIDSLFVYTEADETPDSGFRWDQSATNRMYVVDAGQVVTVEYRVSDAGAEDGHVDIQFIGTVPDQQG